MKLNAGKSHLIISGYKHEQISANIRKDLIWESNNDKLLEVTSDEDLKFDKHVLRLSTKTNQKLSDVSRIAKLLPLSKRRAFFWSFVESQIKYCPIVCIFIVDAPIRKLIDYTRAHYFAVSILSILNVSVIYVNSSFYDCFMISVVYISNDFIAWIGLWCKKIRLI